MLEIDKQLVSDLEISPKYDLPLERPIDDTTSVSKLSYLNEQINQLQAVCWRLRCDYMVMSSASASTPAQKLERENKLAEFTAQLKQYNEGLVSLAAIRDELEA